MEQGTGTWVLKSVQVRNKLDGECGFCLAGQAWSVTSKRSLLHTSPTTGILSLLDSVYTWIWSSKNQTFRSFSIRQRWANWPIQSDRTGGEQGPETSLPTLTANHRLTHCNLRMWDCERVNPPHPDSCPGAVLSCFPIAVTRPQSWAHAHTRTHTGTSTHIDIHNMDAHTEQDSFFPPSPRQYR